MFKEVGCLNNLCIRRERSDWWRWRAADGTAQSYTPFTVGLAVANNSIPRYDIRHDIIMWAQIYRDDQPVAGLEMLSG